MPKLRSILEKGENVRDLYREAFVSERMAFCATDELLFIETFRLLCEACFSAGVDGILRPYRGPDVNPESWKSDLMAVLGDQAKSVSGEGALCSNCCRSVYRKALYVETVDLTERLDKETEAIQPNKKTRAAIFKLYGHRCLDCGSETEWIDHIQPRCLGGTAHFSNLQPLCANCGNDKGARPAGATVILKDRSWPRF